jgi:hypothetical protein
VQARFLWAFPNPVYKTGPQDKYGQVSHPKKRAGVLFASQSDELSSIVT